MVPLVPAPAPVLVLVPERSFVKRLSRIAILPLIDSDPALLLNDRPHFST